VGCGARAGPEQHGFARLRAGRGARSFVPLWRRLARGGARVTLECLERDLKKRTARR